MKLEHTVVVEASLDRTWAVLTTPDLGAPCVPGLEVTRSSPDSCEGVLTVKLGPLPLAYAGAATFRERDAAAGTFVLEATGSDGRGNGTVTAVVTGEVAADGTERTIVSLVSDLTIGGRSAQFGRSVVAAVVDRMVEQFAAAAAGRTPVVALAATNGSARAAARAGVGVGGEQDRGSAAVARASVVATAVEPPAERPVVTPPARPLTAAEPIDPLGDPLAPATRLLITAAAGGVLAALLVLLVVLLRRGRR